METEFPDLSLAARPPELRNALLFDFRCAEKREFTTTGLKERITKLIRENERGEERIITVLTIVLCENDCIREEGKGL